MTPVQAELKSLKDKIKYRRENSLWNHVLTVLRLDMGELNGVVTKDGFKVWAYSHWLGVFHPVIFGTVDFKSEKPTIQIVSKMNSLGQLIAVFIVGLWTSGIISGLIVQTDNSWPFLWKRIILGTVITSFPLIAVGMVVRNEYKYEREKIKRMCQRRLKFEK